MAEGSLKLWASLVTDYDKLIPVLDDRIRMPAKTWTGSKAPPTDDFKKCVIDFKDPLKNALEIRTGSVATDSDKTVVNELGKSEAAKNLLAYLRGGHPTTTTTRREENLAPESTLLNTRVQYVFYMTEALERLKKPASPCLPFARMKNLIDSTTKTETGFTLDDLIARGNKILEKKDDAAYGEIEKKSAPRIAAQLAQAVKAQGALGGRKTRRKQGSTRRKRVKMSRRK